MKVILLQDVPKIGRKYDIKDVSDGFALNMLIPQGKAKTATPDAIKKVESLKIIMKAENKVQEDLLVKNLAEINGKEVKISAKVNDKGHLFAQIHKEDIVKAIKAGTGADVTEDFIVLSKPIKEAGTYDVEIKVGDKQATIKLVV